MTESTPRRRVGVARHDVSRSVVIAATLPCASVWYWVERSRPGPAGHGERERGAVRAPQVVVAGAVAVELGGQDEPSQNDLVQVVVSPSVTLEYSRMPVAP